MKLFFANIWKYIAIFFAGIIAALVWAMNQMKPAQPVINAGTYIETQQQETKIGKVKNRGGGSQDVEQSPDLAIAEPSKREIRKARRRERKSKSNSDEDARLRVLVAEIMSFRAWY